MQTYSLKLTDSQINKIKQTYASRITYPNNPYIDAQYKLDDCTISIYTSKKVVFQGIEAYSYASLFETVDLKPSTAVKTTSKTETKAIDHMGSDEVGTGDYFGPVCVCACIVRKENYALLKELNIADSKKLTDTEIKKIAPVLLDNLEYSILILDNNKYNKIYAENNLNKIKARLHNKAYLNLKDKYTNLPTFAIIDQFTPEKSYYKYLKDEKEVYRNLTFETKAEDKYLAVACASIIARNAFLDVFEKMDKHYDFSFPKGAGQRVDNAIIDFVDKHGKKELTNVAKLHFKNTKVIE